MTFRFSTTPFFNTRQFYYALESGEVDSGFPLAIEHNHSPVKDQKLLCGDLDATTMSMGKYVTSKLVSHTDVVPTDPLAVAAGLTYREGNGMFVRADADVHDPQDLEGRRIGIHDTTLAMTYHKAILETRYDLDPDDVEWVVDTHRALADRMERGDLDAVERINDWYWTMREGDDYRLLYDMGQEWDGLYGYYPLVHLVSVDRAVYDEDPDRVDAFVEALRASREYRDDNHGDVLRAFLAEEDGGEWEGERTVEALRRVTDGVRCPFELGPDQRHNVLDWMRHADEYDVFESAPVSEERLFPE
ncbi:ABC transporter substrate-binding protein [Haloarchaeobius sp. HRN-SO-5]|uniref:ABC transporter substrate-binding protein n=1 Tax=Haloarchaeobius sp. HRN-SO-5 TaxID=3446118 RepID=UPI003EB6F74F